MAKKKDKKEDKKVLCPDCDGTGTMECRICGSYPECSLCGGCGVVEDEDDEDLEEK